MHSVKMLIRMVPKDSFCHGSMTDYLRGYKHFTLTEFYGRQTVKHCVKIINLYKSSLFFPHQFQ
jgi:hypothetical protein